MITFEQYHLTKHCFNVKTNMPYQEKKSNVTTKYLASSPIQFLKAILRLEMSSTINNNSMFFKSVNYVI